MGFVEYPIVIGIPNNIIKIIKYDYQTDWFICLYCFASCDVGYYYYATHILNVSSLTL